MMYLTKKESEVILRLLKDFSRDYNANSLSKKVDMSPRGTLKILNRLEKEGILDSKKFGKAIFYKVNLEDEYALRVVQLVLLKEAKEKASRWLFEFRELFPHVEMVIIFGSVIRKVKNAKDIDVFVVSKKSESKNIGRFIDKRRTVSLKPLHLVKQDSNEFVKNLKERNELLINIIERGYVLKGNEKLVEVIKNVTIF